VPIGLKGNSDGSGAIQIGGSDAISISTGLNTTFAGTITATGTVAGTTGTLYPLVSGTAVASTSGTAIDFTSIPSWVKRITVMLNGVSTNGTSVLRVQIGDGSISTSGYTGTTTALVDGGTVNGGNYGGGFDIRSAVAANVIHGTVVITTLGSNIWVASGVLGDSGRVAAYTVGGSKTLSGTLDRVRITTVNGTDTFDAGSINILFE
jgi:hypothetical protein